MQEKQPTYLKVRDAAVYFYKLTGVKPPCASTVRNWMHHGKRAYDGTIVKLKYITYGKKDWMILTAKEWIDDFAARLSIDNARVEPRRKKVGPPPPPD